LWVPSRPPTTCRLVPPQTYPSQRPWRGGPGTLPKAWRVPSGCPSRLDRAARVLPVLQDLRSSLQDCPARDGVLNRPHLNGLALDTHSDPGQRRERQPKLACPEPLPAVQPKVGAVTGTHKRLLSPVEAKRTPHMCAEPRERTICAFPVEQKALHGAGCEGPDDAVRYLCCACYIDPLAPLGPSVDRRAMRRDTRALDGNSSPRA